VFVVYYALLSIGVTLGESGKINSNVGLWIPNVATLVIAGFFIYKIASEQWGSVSETIMQKV
jgi:lipopolysaccharide export system permease protein